MAFGVPFQVRLGVLVVCVSKRGNGIRSTRLILETNSNLVLAGITGILNLGVNELSGAIPTTIGELVNLETVLLETNFLGANRGDDGSVLSLVPDSFPSQIGLLTNMQLLTVKNNFLSTEGDLDFDYFVSMTNLSKYLEDNIT